MKTSGIYLYFLKFPFQSKKVTQQDVTGENYDATGQQNCADGQKDYSSFQSLEGFLIIHNLFTEGTHEGKNMTQLDKNMI